MPLLMCGIDEAGYGPLLGPLSVGAAAVAVEDWQEGQPAPDLWARLSAAVAPAIKGAAGRVIIADSKALKLQGVAGDESAKRHPLTHLERGVLAWLAWQGHRPTTDDALIAHLGTQWPPHRCYQTGGRAVPASGSESLGILANSLAAAASGSVSPLGLRCRLVGETEFNAIIRESSGKGATTLVAMREHVSWFLSLAASHPTHSLRLVCDRLGGREKYSDILGYLFTDADPASVGITILEETPDRSRYVVRPPGLGRDVGVVFQVESEKAFMPIALASMTAKLCRELAMERFNRWWGGRVPGLKPTAGYWQDAQRWLKAAGDALTPQDKRELVRIA